MNKDFYEQLGTNPINYLAELFLENTITCWVVLNKVNFFGWSEISLTLKWLGVNLLLPVVFPKLHFLHGETENLDFRDF